MQLKVPGATEPVITPNYSSVLLHDWWISVGRGTRIKADVAKRGKLATITGTVARAVMGPLRPGDVLDHAMAMMHGFLLCRSGVCISNPCRYVPEIRL